MIKKILICLSVATFIGCSSSSHYTVKEGDTLYSIAVKNKISVSKLTELNRLSTSNITKGERLVLSSNISDHPNDYHVVKKGENLYRISLKYGVSVEKLKEYNELKNNNIYTGQKIYLFSKTIENKDSQKNQSVIVYGKNDPDILKTFQHPLKNNVIVSSFGYRKNPVTGSKGIHEGVDLKAAMNTPVYATFSGIVTYSGWMSGYGKILIIKNENDYSARFAHLNRWLAKKGDTIKKGQVIAKTGNTGRSTGPHLHYEIRKNGKPIDPAITM